MYNSWHKNKENRLSGFQNSSDTCFRNSYLTEWRDLLFIQIGWFDGWLGFFSISTFVGYLTPNSVYMYIVTWWLTETRRWEWYSPPVELKLSSSQKVTVRNECGSHRCSHLSDLGSPDIGRGRRKWSQMIGGGPQTEVGFPSPQRK